VAEAAVPQAGPSAPETCIEGMPQGFAFRRSAYFAAPFGNSFTSIFRNHTVP
jgi:hypothetical protein